MCLLLFSLLFNIHRAHTFFFVFNKWQLYCSITVPYLFFWDLASNNDNIQAQSEIVRFDSSRDFNMLRTTRDISLLKSFGTRVKWFNVLLGNSDSLGFLLYLFVSNHEKFLFKLATSLNFLHIQFLFSNYTGVLFNQRLSLSRAHSHVLSHLFIVLLMAVVDIVVVVRLSELSFNLLIRALVLTQCRFPAKQFHRLKHFSLPWTYTTFSKKQGEDNTKPHPEFSRAQIWRTKCGLRWKVDPLLTLES